MLVIVALFEDLKQSAVFGEKALAAVHAAFADWPQRLRQVQGAVVYRAGREGADKPAVALALRSVDIKDGSVKLQFGEAKTLSIKSGTIGGEVYRLCKGSGQLDRGGHAPLLYFMEREEFDKLQKHTKLIEQAQALMQARDYKGVCRLFAPLKNVRANEVVWNSAELLTMLGLACSKLSVTLTVMAGETKRLGEARRYRDYCVAFLQRGAALEPDNARCATALAYRYYSNVHELMRPGERRDQDISQQIEKAHEWLSRALEIYPESIRNHYRKGKLIIEKQAPYLLFGKRAFGSREAELLREIREVGEEHLGSAIALYEALEDKEKKESNRREYAKALFVLGGYYLDDAYLPVHEYYLGMLAGSDKNPAIPPISRLNLQSAQELLVKCFAAESDMDLSKLDTRVLSKLHKEWTRSPIEKLYRLGCAQSALAFVARVREESDALKAHADKAIYLLEAAAKTAMQSEDRRRSTWHISEKLAWTHMHAGRYEKAASLLARARQGYIANTRAIALLCCKTPQAREKAVQALTAAAGDRHNLALGLTMVLQSFVLQDKAAPLPPTLSVRNKRLAKLIGFEHGQDT